MLSNFRTHTMAVEFYKQAKQQRLPAYIKDQLLRATMSIALNLAEGSAKPSLKDRVRFYTIALGSLREAQSIIQLEQLKTLAEAADHLGASLYKLVKQ